MATKFYALSDVVVTLTGKNLNLTIEASDLKHFGGISITYTNDIAEIETDYAGSTVITANGARNGEVNLDINQVSDYVPALRKYYKTIGMNLKDSLITITTKVKTTNETIVCNDCVLKKMPDFEAKERATMRTFTFLASHVSER